MLNTADPTDTSGPGEGEAPVAGAGQAMDDADAFIAEEIAEAVILRIDERDKINLPAEAVLERLRERNGTAPSGGNANSPTAASKKASDDVKEPTAQKGGQENGNS